MQCIAHIALLLRNINHFEIQSGTRLSMQEVLLLWCIYFMRTHSLPCGHRIMLRFYHDLTGNKIESSNLSRAMNKLVRVKLASKKIYHMKYTHSPYYITSMGKELLNTFDSHMLQMDENAILEIAKQQFVS